MNVFESDQYDWMQERTGRKQSDARANGEAVTLQVLHDYPPVKQRVTLCIVLFIHVNHNSLLHVQPLHLLGLLYVMITAPLFM